MRVDQVPDLKLKNPALFRSGLLDRESLRVVLLNAKQHLIKVATVSQGTLNEAPAYRAGDERFAKTWMANVREAAIK